VIEAYRLRTEHLTDPVGIDVRNPVLHWNVKGSAGQSAYRVVAKTPEDDVLWDSGKVESGSMKAIYCGTELTSRMRVVWQVRLWDENDEAGGFSEPAFFEMGLLDKDDWKGNWITGNYKPNKKERYPVDYLKKTFQVSKPVSCARLYVTACGLYEASINGKRVGDFVLAPGYTDYRKRIQYQTYDITETVDIGVNTVEFSLADGWFRGCIGALSHRNVFGTETKLLCQLEIVYEDGSKDAIVSDDSFGWSNDGPVRYADLKNGESVDFRLRQTYSGKARLTTHNVVPTASNNVHIKRMERFTPTLVISPSGKTILDFGQNLAGFLSFKIKGVRGHKAILRMGEALANGEFTQENFQCKAKEYIAQKIEVICSGEEDFYETRFSLFGFRYAQVENWPGELSPGDFQSIAVYSAMEETGYFSCSNDLVNKLVANTRWSMKSNFADVPTDCPTREMAGWTGDAQVFCKTAGYLMDTVPFFRKWLLDLSDRQTKEGKVHCIVPTVGNEGYIAAMDGSVGWADAAVIVPYVCWKLFGDLGLLKRCYPSMRSYALFCIRRASHTFITRLFRRNPYRKYTYDCYQHFGEWLEPPGVEPGNFIVNIILPRPEEATAYLSYIMSLMRDAAHQLNEHDDEKLWDEYAEGAKKAYNYLFVNNGDIDTDRQAKLVRPLALGLLDGDAKKNVAARLAKVLEKNDFRIGTGFLSTPFLLPVLSENGYIDVAYKTLENTEAPGWLWQILHGATTICENWVNIDPEGKPAASQNHYSFGAVCDWLFSTVGGINVAGENRFLIKPVPGGTLTYADTEYQSVYGKVETHWRIDNDNFSLEVIIPSGTEAKVIMPDGSEFDRGAGKHSLQSKVQE